MMKTKILNQISKSVAAVIVVIFWSASFVMQSLVSASVTDGEELLKKIEQIEELKIKLSAAGELVTQEYQQYVSEKYHQRVHVSDAKVPFKIMWIIYQNGYCDGISYTLSDDCLQMAKATMNEFERLVEMWSDNNVDIINESVIVDRIADTSAASLKELSLEIAKPEIDLYADPNEYNCVITVSNIDTYLGVAEGSSVGSQGYLTMCVNRPGTTSLTHNTNVAIHEFLHTLEGIRDTLPLLFPYVHSYWGSTNHPAGEKYPGYEAYVSLADWKKQNIQFETDCRKFYKDVLQANVKYTDPITKKVSYIGMTPSMWGFITESQRVMNQDYYLGLYSIQNAETGKDLIADENILKIDYLAQNGLTIVGIKNKAGWGNCVITSNNDGTYSLVVNDGSDYRYAFSEKWKIIMLKNGEKLP